MARPSKYTKAIGDRICRRLAEGESLRSICSDPKLPTKSTVLLWVVDGKHDSFSDQYTRAREAAGYSHADRIIDTIDQVGAKDMKPEVAKVILDGLKWSAERMSPKAHSPRHQLTGAGGGPVESVTTIELVAADGDEGDA
ncbi:hypothetical protein ACGTNG_12595 [Halomonas sp. 1390]|uniref:terminase small subunit-like protein n=1 Tax=Halomonas sp. B23F22_3 TaxID=3459516 RepID=UPI00373F38A3